MRLDPTYIALLQLLQKNARASVAELAHTVGRSESTTRDLLLALEACGYVRGYRAELDLDRLGFQVRSLLRARCDLRQAQALARHLSAQPNVVHAALTTGPKPLLVEVVARDMQHLEHMLETGIAPLELEGLETEVYLQRMVRHRPPSLASLESEEVPPIVVPAQVP